MRAEDFSNREFRCSIGWQFDPLIDKLLPSGQTKEEWKGYAETNKILGLSDNPTWLMVCVYVSVHYVVIAKRSLLN